MLLLLIGAAAGLVVEKQPNELFLRQNCETCCRVLFAADVNPGSGTAYVSGTPYVMDMEVETSAQLLGDQGGSEQSIVLRALVPGRDLQFFELASFKMIALFMHPKRVHDFRAGIYIGNRLIQWGKKPPLLESTNNQRFLYVYDYPDSYYTGTVYESILQYKKHFNCPYYNWGKVCYQTSPVTTQGGWRHITTFSDRNTRQISVEYCSNDNNKILNQQYTLVFA